MANFYIIRDLCEQKGITFRELCQRVGRDESTIHSAIRRGSTNTTTLEQVAQVLGVSAGIFFDDYEPGKVAELQKEIDHLHEIIDEKERTIKILLANKK